jgi:hypothetical protein
MGRRRRSYHLSEQLAIVTPLGRWANSIGKTPPECEKGERMFPSDGEVQVRGFAKLFIMSDLRGTGLAYDLHLYQWPGTVPRSYAS